MKIQTIYDEEQHNEGKIYLRLEGIFWKAYERSAYLFSTHIKAYSVKQRHYKVLNTDVVSLGFPQSAWAHLQSQLIDKIVVMDAKRIEITDYGLDIAAFEQWKHRQPLSFSKAHTPSPAQSPTSLSDALGAKIRHFNIAAKTPIECQQFLFQLQNELDG